MTPHHLRLAATLLLGLTLACSANNQEPGAPCDDSDACAVGLTCFAGACRSPCNLSTDCSAGTGCSAGLCVPLTTGTCGQPADCRTPPDACRTAVGARCITGRCEYSRSTAPECREECLSGTTCDGAGVCQDAATARCVNTGCVYDPLPNGTPCDREGTGGVCNSGSCVDCVDASDCDPRDYGYDLCTTAACVNRACTFTEVTSCNLAPLGSTCDQDDQCRSGWCTSGYCCASRCNGTCIACGADGLCDDTPVDDSRCGNIDCDALDTICRDYRDYDDTTGERCASFGACVAANSADCALFVNASNATVCREALLACDQPEKCSAGVCPTDAFLDGGAVCNPSPPAGEDEGRCNGESAPCYKLPVMPLGARYFLEEATTAADREDYFVGLPLDLTGTTGIARVTGAVGDGIAWSGPASDSIYCAPLGIADFAQVQRRLAFEVVVSIADAANMPDSTIIFMGPTEVGSMFARAKLGVRRNPADPSGVVTFTGTFGLPTATDTWRTTIGPRAVVHLVIDARRAGEGEALRLFVDGLEVTRETSGSVPASMTLVDTDVLCIGNDHVAGSGAFAGTLWYAAAYDEEMTDTQVMDAAIRLSVADE